MKADVGAMKQTMDLRFDALEKRFEVIESNINKMLNILSTKKTEEVVTQKATVFMPEVQYGECSPVEVGRFGITNTVEEFEKLEQVLKDKEYTTTFVSINASIIVFIFFYSLCLTPLLINLYFIYSI